MPDLLIEIGTEEIPASYIAPALREIGDHLSAALAEARLLPLEEPTLLATARRLVIHIAEVPAESTSEEVVRHGPPAKVAFDGDGNPTKAGLGFARGQGVDPAELRVVETEKGPRVAATVTLPGRPATEIVAEVLPAALRSASFPKTMRWTGSDLSFARPIRSLLALYGDDVVAIEVAGVRAGRITRGHPFLAPEPIELPSADLSGYVAALEARKVAVDQAARKKSIVEQLSQHGLLEVHEGLLDEVTYLVQWPVVIEGRIDPDYLELPVEVLETAMRVHLRFFPVIVDGRRAEPRFLAVMDREEGAADVVREGNERVLRSRLYDARFFLDEDRKRRLEEFVPELADKELHRELGSYREKADRLAELSAFVAAAAWPSDDLEEKVRRASLLAKADLVTEMVGEFPELQGTVGRIYAELDGEDPAVALAVEDHYRPRGPGDALPREPVGFAVALAEKLDDLSSFFRAVGAPSGSSDPFGLRRQALGLIRITRHAGVSFSLREALELAGGAVDEVLAYLGERLHQYWVDEGVRHDLVRAALGPGFDDLADFHARLGSVVEVSEEAWWPDLVAVAERTTNILKGVEVPAEVDRALLSEKEEHALHAAFVERGPEVGDLVREGRYAEAMKTFADAFGEPVHRFFEEVFVNVDDTAIRMNRLALLGRVNSLIAPVADLSDVDRGTEAGGT